jgi:tetratricopeptide (TPR) repeat protein
VTTQTQWWRRAQAYWWFAWAQSLTYWGNRLVSRMLYDWAISAYGRVLTVSPAHAQAYCRRGALKGREFDDYTGAIRDLSAAIELRPEWAEPYLQRGLLHRFHGRVSAERALEDLRRYLELGASPFWRSEVERQIEMLEAEIDEHDERTGRRGT